MSFSPKLFILALILSLLLLTSAAPTPLAATAATPDALASESTSSAGAALEEPLVKATRGKEMRAVRSADTGEVPAKPENSPVHGS
eukprot:CAMPEP_0174897114 /NCGR_PEP_ID=MMETSP0167-20121228/11710_1 /TAXON_ID=38298 /ORGANISM="Rhodella maculata, Strain CCMP736" /LENGTH=85 /DNA_ID=CAMNT_0016136879 /DNA_START=51 /DNA_END=308 /DNA_ORIENTATION=+